MNARRDLLPAAAGVAAAGVLGLTAYFVVDTLPQPTEGIDAATAALETLGRVRLEGAVVHLGGRTFDVSCRSRGLVDILTLPDGRRIVVRGTKVVRKPTTVPLARAVPIADLGGSRRLIMAELTAAARRTDVLLVAGSFDSGRTVSLRLGRIAPHVDLVISRTTMAPLGLRYASDTIQGSSELLPAPPPGQQLLSSRRGRAHGC